MVPLPIASPTNNSFPSNTSSPASRSYLTEGHNDENNFSFQNNTRLWTTTTTTTREAARKPIGSLSSSLSEIVASTTTTLQATSSSVGPLSITNQQQISTVEGWVQKPDSQFLPPRPVESSASSSPGKSSFSPSTMREPIAVSSLVDHRHTLTPRTNDGAIGATNSMDLEMLEPDHESAMTGPGRRSRNSTESQVLQDSIISSTPPRPRPPGDDGKRTATSSNIPRNPKDTMTASPSFRSRPTPPPPPPPPRDTLSVHSHTSGSVPLPPSSADWQWGKRSDPDDQEQALFEQRLCEDAYGVAVRKINQNGKSNLRYVKCCMMDSAELEESNGIQASSSRSVSSRSRGAFSRLRGDRDRSLERSEAGIMEAQRLIKKGEKKRVLTWGKKKDVKLPLDRFISVRTGKTTDRSRRNTNPASRILSLITDDPQNPSLDIEAPTRLDRDKFARAFSRFLVVPLESDDVQSVLSASVTSQNHSAREQRKVLAGTQLAKNKPSSSSVPDTSAASPQLPRATRKSAPPPMVTTAPSSDDNGRHLQMEIGGKPEKARAAIPKQSAVPPAHLTRVANETATLDYLNAPDPQIASLPSSNMDSYQNPIAALPASLKAHSTAEQTSLRSVVSESHEDAHPHADHDADEGTVVSSLTGAGFDQEIVEELHMALNDLKKELEDSRAEAARAVKVAEQAIQSAENSNSKDWNSTVTHKAAEAAALAQKKSAEAMAKQRLAEERLEGERRNAAFWRKQAESAEEEAGALQTRAAAAEVQRAGMAEALEAERRKATLLVGSMKQRISATDSLQRETVEATMQRNRQLELELESMRRKLIETSEVTSHLQDSVADALLGEVARAKKKLGLLGRNKKDGKEARTLLSTNFSNSSQYDLPQSASIDSVSAPDILKVYAEYTSVRRQFELLKLATADELNTLPKDAQMWASQASQAVMASQAEITRLRSKLAMESATRRKLLHEVQDLRGAVRVYCRPRVPKHSVSAISVSSREVILLHRERAGFKDVVANNLPLSFEFDGIFDTEMGQDDIYNELEEVCLGALDGYNVCVMAYGQRGGGKTHTILGSVAYTQSELNEPVASISNFGIHLLSVKQLFSVIKHRNERYQDVVTLTIVEVHNERLCDLLAGTDIGEARGRLTVEDSRSSSRKGKIKRSVPSQDDGSASQIGTSVSSKPVKLEIKTNHNGETIVHGLLSVEVSSFEDVFRIWNECLSTRASRISEQGLDLAEHEANSHVFATIKIASTNISTGIGSTGKIQFVDLAGSDLVAKRVMAGTQKKASSPEAMLTGVGNNKDWKFVNKSMSALNEVVHARSQFQRSVPYRNSTLTHLLSDSMEADTKVVLVACVSSDLKDLQETACTLRFAQKMRKVVVGKATKHTLTHA